MIAVILNDLKEWSEYIPKDDPNMIVDILENYLMDKCFILDHMPVDQFAYVNVNTPQTNTTWQRIWDKQNNETPDLEKETRTDYSWEVDPTCDVQIVYFYKTELDSSALSYLYRQYGRHGEYLKTVCDKMDVFIDRETGLGYYLTTDGEWKLIGGDSNMSDERVLELIRTHRGKINRTWEDSHVALEILDDQAEANSNLELLTVNDVEEML